MQSRLAFSKRCEVAKRKNANEESRLRSELQRCEKEYEKAMRSMFEERHDMRTSIRDLRRVKCISLDTKALSESDNFDNRTGRLANGAVMSPRLGGRRLLQGGEIASLKRAPTLGERTNSMPNIHESNVGLKPQNLPVIPDRKLPPNPTTVDRNQTGDNRYRSRTFPGGNAREFPCDGADDSVLSDSGSRPASGSKQKYSPTQPRPPPFSLRHRASLATTNGNDGKFFRRFRAVAIPEDRTGVEDREEGVALVAGAGGACADKESADPATALAHRKMSRLQRPRSCSVRTISAPGVLENQMSAAGGRSRSLTLSEGCRPRSNTSPDGMLQRQHMTSPRSGEFPHQARPGEQAWLLEVDRGGLASSPHFRRKLSPSAGIARLRQESDAALATRTLVSRYRRDQCTAKTEEELKATRQEARKRIGKRKEANTHEEEETEHSVQCRSGTRRTFMSIIRFVLAVNAFKALRVKGKMAEDSPDSDEETEETQLLDEATAPP